MIFNLSEQNSIANQFLIELRDSKIQRDRMRFRKNMERLGEIMAYEISKVLLYKPVTVETLLGSTQTQVIARQPVLLTILRAGFPYVQGFLNFFDQSDVGFIGAYRVEGEKKLTIKLDYVATPNVKDAEVILIDPMLATGRSIVDTISLVMQKGTPQRLHIVSLIAAPEGIEHVRKSLTVPYSLWTCVVDEKLNDLFYIVPGLGDAGDLSFGPKL